MSFNNFRTLVLSAAAAAMVVVAIASPAEAGRRHKNNAGPAVAAGIIGLAAGLAVAGALSQPRTYYYDYEPSRRVYYVPRKRVYVAPSYDDEPGVVYYRERPRRVYRTYSEDREPWTREWYRYCKARFRSFDPESGTYLGYDGLRHFCN